MSEQREAVLTMDKQAENIDRVLDRMETAAILGISKRTLQRMETRGAAPARVKISDRIIGYRESAIREFLEARTVS